MYIDQLLAFFSQKYTQQVLFENSAAIAVATSVVTAIIENTIECGNTLLSMVSSLSLVA